MELFFTHITNFMKRESYIPLYEALVVFGPSMVEIQNSASTLSMTI